MKKIVIFLTVLFISNATAQNKAFEVEVIGKGAPVLLLPGFSCTGDVWKETVEVLSKTHECHVFTFAGFGEVPAIEKPWLPKVKESIEAYVEEKKLQQPTIIGHSLGGTLGLWLASDAPIRYRKLIVVDGLPSVGALMIPNFKAEDIVYDNPYSKQQFAMNDTEFKAMAKQYAAFMSLNKDKHQQLVDWMVMADRKTYVYGYTDLLKLDLREAIAKIEIPVVLLAATYPNKQMVMANYKKQYANLQDITMLYADDSAHFIMYDQPKWFFEKITEHIR